MTEDRSPKASDDYAAAAGAAKQRLPLRTLISWFGFGFGVFTWVSTLFLVVRSSIFLQFVHYTVGSEP